MKRTLQVRAEFEGLGCKFRSVHAARHDHVGEDERQVVARLDDFQAFGTIRGNDGFKTHFLDHCGGDIAHRVVVFDNKHDLLLGRNCGSLRDFQKPLPALTPNSRARWDWSSAVPMMGFTTEFDLMQGR